MPTKKTHTRACKKKAKEKKPETYPTTCRMVVTPKAIKETLDQFTDFLDKKIREKGDVAFASSHETLGVIEEEVDELKDAVRANVGRDHELLDIMVSAFWGLASHKRGAWTW